MLNSCGHRLVSLAYALFLVLFVGAAAGYGLTRNSTLIPFQWGMAGVVALWLLGHLLRGTYPSTGGLPWLFGALILAYGWFVTAVGIIDEAIVDDRLPGWDEWFPDVLLAHWASYHPELSVASMLTTTVLIGAMLLAIDLWRSPHWARALILIMVFSAFGMVIFFLLQRLFGAPFQLIGIDGKTPLAFGTYRYWGTAASYLNLLWPVTAAVALFAALRQSAGWALWLIPAAALYVANFLNVSKAGNALAVVGALLFAALAVPLGIRELKRSKIRVRPSYVLGALLPILVIALCLPYALPWERWQYLAQANMESRDGRLQAYQTFLGILPDSGWVGFGPGTFQKQYRRYVEDDPILRNVPYWVAHQDYIQTAIEWGYLGTLLWAALLVPGGFHLLLRARQRPERAPREFAGYRIGLGDHLKAFFETAPNATEPALALGATVAVTLTALHSLVDFPMQVASIQLYFLLLIALGWSYRGRKPTQPPEEEDPD